MLGAAKNPWHSGVGKEASKPAGRAGLFKLVLQATVRTGPSRGRALLSCLLSREPMHVLACLFFGCLFFGSRSFMGYLPGKEEEKVHEDC